MLDMCEECGEETTLENGLCIRCSYDTNNDYPGCPGHPTDEFSPMGQTLYCDGSCQELS